MTPVDRPIIIWGVTLVLASQIHWIFYVGTVIMTLDIIARWRDYRWLKGHQFHPGIVYQMRKSWCSRGVAECLYGQKAREIYRLLGYRWYHILPDGFPRVFMTSSFWKHVVGLYRR